MSPKPVIVRFPPSPTGFMHIGRARTALFNYLFAKHHGGKLIFRLEDTDKERSKPEYEADIIEGLTWLGITWDNETIYRQSERTNIYREHLHKMIESGKAYVEAGEQVVRFKNPNTTITFTDLIRGEISFDTTDLGDFIIARSVDDPLYHLTVVVDDFDMGITHVIRGEDGISNTPRQILIQEAIGAPRPEYAHIPLILAPDKTKLSGRHGAVGVSEYRDQGFLPEAMINYLAILGWSPQAKTNDNSGTNEEILSLDELIKLFNLDGVQKSGATFSLEKLKWINKEYLKRLSDDERLALVKEYFPHAPEYMLMKVTPILFDRVQTLGEMKELQDTGEFDYFFTKPVYDKALLKNQDHLHAIIKYLEVIPDSNFSAPVIKESVWEYASAEGRANVLWPMRVALSGQEKSPDPFTLAEALGKQETIDRLTHATTL